MKLLPYRAFQFLSGPVGIAFANSKKAYVALSSENQIAVIDTETRTIKKRIKIPAQEPRAITVRNERLYVIPFESNNQTQLSGGAKEDIDGKLVTFDAWNHSVIHNNVLSLGHVVDIIKHPGVPDKDLFVFDTETDKRVATVEGIGTLLYGLAVDSTGNVFVAQTDARNDVNGRSGTKKHGLEQLQNRAFLNQITRVDSDFSRPPKRIELEPAPPTLPSAEEAIATPFAVEISPDDKTVFVAAAGSDKLVTIDAGSQQILDQVSVGAVPRGIELYSNGEQTTAWVFDAVDNAITVVDATDRSNLKVTKTIPLEDPTAANIKNGRKLFNSAAASTSGTFSCASCHPDGHTDQLLWVLRTPIVSGGNQIMPRSTMPLRGLRDTEPFHWDGIPGDPYGGNNSANVHSQVDPNFTQERPENAIRHLVDGALATTMKHTDHESENDEGKAGAFSSDQRTDLSKFLLSIPFPPAQKRSYTNELSPQARRGFELFHILGDDDPTKHSANVCGDCHRMPHWVSTNTPGTGMDAPTWRGAYDRWLILPQGRLNIIEFDFFSRVANRGLDEQEIWRFSWAGRRRFNPVWNMVLEGSTGVSGTFGRQLTLNAKNADEESTLDLLNALERSASEETIVLEANGVLISEGRSEQIQLQFFPNDHGGTYHSGATEHRFKSEELVELASFGSFVGTFTAHLGEPSETELAQPSIWTLGPIQQQRGHQRSPYLYPGKYEMKVSGRHVAHDARLVVNGRLTAGELKLMEDEVISIRLESLPSKGVNVLQLLNPGGRLSNDFLFHVAADKASADANRTDIQQQRTDKRISLINAVNQSDIDKIKVVLNQRVDINGRHPENGSTTLTTAALRGNLKVVNLLLSKGAKVNYSNRDGNTALHVSAFMCQFEVVNRLLEKGASRERKNRKGETAADAVKGEWNQGLADFYRLIGRMMEIDLDLETIKRQRPKMLERLGQGGE